MAGVRDDRAVLQLRERLFADDVHVPRRGDEEVAARRGIGDRRDLEAVHGGLERAEGIHLAHDRDRAHAAQPRRDAATDPTVARDDRGLPREEQICRAQHAVDRGLTGAVAVVEEVLRERVVHRDDRVREDALSRHRAQPRDAGRRLFGPALHVREQLASLRVQFSDEVRAVVHRELRLCREHGIDMRVIGVTVLAFAREHADVVVRDEGRRDVILRRERVRRAERDVRAARRQGLHEVRGLGSHVQTGADANPGQGPLLGEALTDTCEHRHLARRPLDATLARAGLSDVAHVVFDGVRGHRILPSSRSRAFRRTAGPSRNGAWTR